MIVVVVVFNPALRILIDTHGVCIIKNTKMTPIHSIYLHSLGKAAVLSSFIGHFSGIMAILRLLWTRNNTTAHVVACTFF
uniref:Vomeronasal type-1 receptor n=1 Tax=Pyxicephalus adspersus TaxID=30357 RepID=A0AAV3A4X1_PYXAD|nr:TPA: hypothetical protein GDO54_017551 [Pyxicephalus adspersus]